MFEYPQHYDIGSHFLWISVISVFPLIYCWMYFTIKDVTTTEEAKIVLPDIVVVSSSGPAAELYPDSLGEYRLMQDLTLNDRPVFKHSARDDRYINSVGKIF